MDIINSLLAILAAGISTVALIRTRKNTGRLIELEEIHAELSRKQLKELETKERESTQANLIVRLDSPGSSGRFIIENLGPATATNIYFSLTQDGEHNPLVHGDFEKKTPYPALNAGEQYYLAASFPIEVTQRVYRVSLRWENEDTSVETKAYSTSR